MADFSKEMSFTFIETPNEITLPEGPQSTIKVNTSSLSLTLQSFLLRILPLLTITAKENAMSYIFEENT